MRTIYDITTDQLTVDPDWVAPPSESAPPAIPTRITRRQGRLALHHAGLLDQVEAMMKSPDTPREHRITYEDALEWWRDDPMIVQTATTLNLSNTQIDNLFIQASRL